MAFNFKCRENVSANKCVTKFGCLLPSPWDKCHHLSPGAGEGAGRGEGKIEVQGKGKAEDAGHVEGSHRLEGDKEGAEKGVDLGAGKHGIYIVKVK